jgi:P-type Cu2+ transporter
MSGRAVDLQDPEAGCVHCGSPIPTGAQEPGFCCAGCAAVHRLLEEQGLSRYYELSTAAAPISVPRADRPLAWLEPLVAQSEAKGPLCALELDVQGIHCAACVWLMNELFRREPGGAGLTVNPALGKLRLSWRRGEFGPERFLRRVEAFGYLFGPSRKRAEAGSSDLPLRLGVSAAITLNVMLFSLSFYLGLAPTDGALFEVFTQLSLWLSAVVVVVGGWPFFRAAFAGLRSGMLHLDLPIAVGIALVFVTSALQARSGRGDLAYFDTLNTFVTLMLLGRWLQLRVLEKNRKALLEDAGLDGLFVRRLEGGRLVTISATSVREGDELLLSPGDLLPVDAELLDGQARLSAEWISGESAPVRATCGEQVGAGCINAGTQAVRVLARGTLLDSPLPALLQSPAGGKPLGAERFWSVLSRGWVAGVLCLSAFAAWLWWPQGPHRALEITAALLVVTCPCALGIAVPLAYELTQARLRALGLFVRSREFLDRLVGVRAILLDKTGTLTLGRLELSAPQAVRALPVEAQEVAYNLAARSNHPVSRAIVQELGRAQPRFDPGLEVHEVPAHGLELVRHGVRWRLGRSDWACAQALGAPTTVLAKEGVALATLDTREAVRPDAAREVAALQGLGLEVWLLSGDGQTKVSAMAAELGVPIERALGQLSPQDKAAQVERIGAGRALFLGDGVNDSLAFDRALCAGTPAVDRPVLPSKSDFYLLGEGLAGIRAAVGEAQRLRAVVHRSLGVALLYNAGAVTACLLGAMTPLRAAIAMPASSLLALGLVVLGLQSQRRSATRRRPAVAPMPRPPEPARVGEVSQ